MRDQTEPVNMLAPIANVALMLELVQTVKNRPPFLPGIGVFSGPAGYGKTTAATVAASEFDAIVIEVNSNFTTKHLFITLCRELGIPERGTRADLADRIARELLHNERPLIIDEADHLVKKQMIEDVRGLIEGCDGSLILIGEELLPNNLVKWERIHSRVLKYVQAQPVSRDDAEVLARIYARGVAIGDDLFDALLKASGASARRLSTNLYKIAEAARRGGAASLSLADWTATGEAFNTGRPPEARRNLT